MFAFDKAEIVSSFNWDFKSSITSNDLIHNLVVVICCKYLSIISSLL